MPDHPVTAFLSWAHQPDPGLDAAVWRDQVLEFVAALRNPGGIDADLDLHHASDSNVDWSRYGPRRVRECDFVLVAVNAAWRERFEGTNDPGVGAGAVAEANELLGLFAEDQAEFCRKVKLVLLPGAAARDVPRQLSGVQRFSITDPTPANLATLLRTLTNQPEYIPPAVGIVPVLPPRTLDEIEYAVTLAAEASLTVGGRVSAPAPATALGHLEIGGRPAPVAAATASGHIELSGSVRQRAQVEAGIALLRSAQAAAGTHPEGSAE